MYKKLQAVADRMISSLVPKVDAAACSPGCYVAGHCPVSRCKNGCTIYSDCGVRCY
ncbi:hypothetical protein LRS74_27555 [Streptomyces sp. LX-29]|uniref:hypothetical protein n=1 Tax=unclassified Streptomyces TaxID=2593676 RepID=UPI0016434D58|nr:MULTISPECIES: hypothetical protein [unclassified Streptomyces]WFB10375.1 hypothetical protein LRS74_27555 [Streptomyces sp. LX-29]